MSDINALITLTPEQQAQLEPLFAQLEDGGAVFAQIWTNAMHVVVFTPKRAQEITAAIAPERVGLENYSRSAGEAYSNLKCRIAEAGGKHG